MSNFTKEMIDSYANKLLIGLTDEEEKMIQEEFDQIEKNMNKINKIENINEIEPLSYPYDMYIDDLRSDEVIGDEIPVDELLRNCDQVEGREVEVPKVVG